jgi:tRNA-guanine family transglycosylase
MGNLLLFCAGVERSDYPPGVNLLLNLIDNAATDHSIGMSSQLIEATGAGTAILDSGGNAIFNRERAGRTVLCDPDLPLRHKGLLNLTPRHLIAAAKKLKPTAVIALDNPLQKKRSKTAAMREFRKKLRINIQWAFETAELREKHCPDIKLLVPIQARSLQHFEIFIEKLEGLRFDGISMPNRNINTGRLIVFLIRLYQLRIEWVHVLGTLSFTNLAIAAYFARNNYFELVSLDSMTAKRAALNGKYLSPHDLSKHFINHQTEIPSWLKMDCACPFCRNRSFAYIKHLPYPDRHLFLNSHNFAVIEKVSRELFENAGSIGQLAVYMKTKSPKNTKTDELISSLYLAEQFKDENIYALAHLLET